MLDFAQHYLDLRRRGDWLVIGLNLAAAAGFVLTPLATMLQRRLSLLGGDEPLRPYLLVPLYCSILFIAHAGLNFPFEFWYGYALDRQFGLAKDGARAWTRAWMIGVIQQGVMFVIGSSCIIICQTLMNGAWLAAAGAMLLILILLTRMIEADLLPVGLFQLDRVDPTGSETLFHREQTTARGSLSPALSLPRSTGGGDTSTEEPARLPPVVVFGHLDQRDIACASMGWGQRRVLLLSRPAVALASPQLLNLLIHRALHAGRLTRNLAQTILAWMWIIAVMGGSVLLIPPRHFAQPTYIAWLALTTSIGLALTRLAFKLRPGNADAGTPSAQELDQQNLDAGPRLSPLMHLICRLTMWLPNPLCRCGLERLGRPPAWFLR